MAMFWNRKMACMKPLFHKHIFHRTSNLKDISFISTAITGYATIIYLFIYLYMARQHGCRVMCKQL